MLEELLDEFDELLLLEFDDEFDELLLEELLLLFELELPANCSADVVPVAGSTGLTRASTAPAASNAAPAAPRIVIDFMMDLPSCRASGRMGRSVRSPGLG